MVRINRLLFVSVTLYFLVAPSFPITTAFTSVNENKQLFFDAETSYDYLAQQMGLGPRIPASNGSKEARELIARTLGSEWRISFQNFTPSDAWNWQDLELVNIIAEQTDDSSTEWIILGAHYDTRRFADSDPDPVNRTMPVPGANDGASGVAVLLEIAKVITKHELAGIRLVFFDGEDQGRLDGWPWIVGSSYYVSQLSNSSAIQAAIIIDMIGDADLQIFKERNSVRTNPNLVDSIWETAADLDYDKAFIPIEKYSILDDHTPFLNRGIPAVDIIDFDYPYWHTVEDTTEKVSAESLGIVGKTIERWLLQEHGVFRQEDSKKTTSAAFWILTGMIAASIAFRFRKHENLSKQESF
ncbi:MAG: M28 family peptidase [Candidatus Hodarchaeota archaeon]